MKRNIKLSTILLLSYVGLLSQATLADDATVIQLGRMQNWNPPRVLSLQLLGSDQTTRTQAWAVVTDNDICQVPAGSRTLTVVNFAENAQLLNDALQTKRILDKAIASHAEKCPPNQFRAAIAVARNISAIDLSFIERYLSAAQGNSVIDGVLAQRRLWPDSNNDYLNKVAARQHEAQRAGQEKQRKEMAQSALDQRAQAFANRYGATGGWVKWSQFKANPFSYEGKSLLFNADFTRMVSPTSAIFEAMVVSDIPRNAFTRPGRVLLAGKVLGTTNVPNQFGGQSSLPHVKYLGHIICETEDCNGHYGGRIDAR